MAVYEAQCRAVGGFGYAGYFKLYVELTDGNISGNTSKVTYNVYCKSSGSGSINATHLKYFNINGQDIINSTVNVNVSSPNAYISIASGTTGAIQHNSDGSKAISFSAQIKGTTYGVSASISGTFNLTKTGGSIPTFTRNPSITDRTINSIIFNWGDVNIPSDIYYSLNNSTWTHVESSRTIISGLTPETTYTIYVQARNQADNSLRNTTTISATTYAIAKISSVANVNIGSSHTINWTNPSGATTSLKLCKTDGTQVINYGTVTGTSKSITPTASTIYALTPNSNNITLRYIITTTVNNTSYTNYKDCVFTVTNSNPIFSDFTYQDTNDTIIALTGNNQTLVKGYSNVKGIISVDNKASAKNSATMKSYKMLIGSKNIIKNYSSTAEVNMNLPYVETNIIDMYAIDSRGNSTKISKTATIKDYSGIKITSVTATRENNVGKAVTLKFEGQFWNENFGSVENTITSCIYKYKNTTSSEYKDEEIELTYTITGNKIIGNTLIKGDLGASGFDVSNSYNIQMTLSDRLSTATYTITLGSGNPAISVYKNSVAIGQKYDMNKGGKLQVNESVNLLNDTGDTYYIVERTDTGTRAKIGVGSGGTNHGIWSDKLNKWMIYSDGSKVYVNNCAIDGLKTASSKTHTNYNTNQSYIPAMSFLTYWNGAYNGNNNSNITYCHQGEIQAKPTVLYNNTSGTTGTVTLSETAANFSYLEIFFRNDNNRYKSIKVYSPNGKVVSLFSTSLDNNSASNIKYKDMTTSGNTISNIYTQTLQFWNGAWHNTDGNNVIYILRVIGYK